MLRSLLAAFRSLFGSRKGRLAVAALVVVTAAVPVFEMLVLRLFSALIVEGPRLFEGDIRAALPRIAFFLGAFGLARGAHHLVRLARVWVYRRGFASSGRTSTPSQESWEWAQAFELTTVLVSMVQVVMFSALFLVLDVPVGLVNLVSVVVVLVVVSRLYGRQMGLQRDYLTMGSKPGSVAVSARVGGRVKDAEIGAIAASLAMVGVLVFMLARTLQGHISSPDAIVLFLALRLVAGQLANQSAGMMRFARASARRGF